MGYQKWLWTTANQTVTEIVYPSGTVVVNKTFAQLNADDPNWEITPCPAKGKVFLSNQTLTSALVTVKTDVDGEQIGVIVGSGTRPTCSSLPLVAEEETCSKKKKKRK